MTLQAIYETYDAERGLNVQTLAATAASLQLTVTTAKTQSEKQRQVSQVLPVSWQGEAGTRGIQVVANLSSHSETDCTAAQQVLNALNAASTTMLETVRNKVNTLDQMLVNGKVEVAGLTPGDIDKVIDGRLSGEIDKDVWQKMLPGAIFPKKYPDQIKTACGQWLQQTFVYKYEQMLAAFTTACSIARTAIEGKYDAIATALNAIEEKSYDSAKSVAGSNDGSQKPDPGDPSKATEDKSKTTDQSKGTGSDTSAAGTQSADTSSTGTSAKTTTGSQTPDTTTDETTTDDTTTDNSETSSALTTLASTISELGTTLSSALTGDLGDTLTSAAESVGTSISDGIEQMSEQASSLLSGEHEASFQLGDTKVSIESGENGLSLTTTDANGDSQQYRLILDENGLPVIEQESSSADPTATGDDSHGVLGSGTPESGTGQGEAGLSEAGAGAEGATPTTSETPDLTDAPVTSEIGNGDPSSGSVAGGVPVGPRSSQQETDGEHTPSVDDHQMSNPGDSGAILSEAGPL
ncbi:hypothetical protein [Nocardia salmonicida]|uniref:hypothetical protein n=1 Tax=Nocardia salmonicida TaxID=53431 RepID=UPI00341F7260